MAWIYSLDIECGANREQAQQIYDYFANLEPIVLSDEISVKCKVSIQQRGTWFVWVIPQGVGIGTQFVDERILDREHTSEIGSLLLERLKNAPPAFRYSLVGWEVDGARTPDEFSEDDFEKLFGLVISEDFLQELGFSPNLESFRPGYRWLLYQGETWEPK